MGGDCRKTVARTKIVTANLLILLPLVWFPFDLKIPHHGNTFQVDMTESASDWLTHVSRGSNHIALASTRWRD